MPGEMNFETYADVYSDMFDEYLSGVTAKGLKDNEKYKEVRGEIEALYEKFPKVLAVFDLDRAAELSKEECEALIQVMMLKNDIIDLELQSVYLRGCYDSVGFMKKAGVL